MSEGTGKPCPICGDRMVNLPSKNKRLCCCGHQEPWRLKEGEKSTLEKNKDKLVS